jgi:hypothetical protein
MVTCCPQGVRSSPMNESGATQVRPRPQNNAKLNTALGQLAARYLWAGYQGRRVWHPVGGIYGHRPEAPLFLRNNKWRSGDASVSVFISIVLTCIVRVTSEQTISLTYMIVAKTVGIRQNLGASSAHQLVHRRVR